MNNAVTIDRLDIKSHTRYAQDQQKLDTKYTHESSLIHPHSEITGTSTIYTSSWELLFETQKKNLPWASFLPPRSYALQSKRFFSYRIIPSMDVGSEDDEEDEEQKEGREQELIEKLLSAVKEEKHNKASFEGEQKILLNLFNSMRHLNQLLAQINARKLQYQKG